ncbi:1270_t:CDS:2 [Entrophospora sp. SA101]|nr:1270_t:CDS:2 [Entrophospora sp. SA101]
MKNTLTLKDKREICVIKQSKPTPTNKDLAIQDPNSHNKRLRKGKYSGLKDALIL